MSQANSKNNMENQGTQNVQNNLEGEEIWMIHIS